MAINTADNAVQMVASKSQANNVDIATRESGEGGDVEMVAEELDEGGVDMLMDEFRDGNIDAGGDVEMAAGQLVSDVELAVLVIVDDEDDEMETEEGEEHEDMREGQLVNDVELAVLVVVDDEDDKMEAEEGEEREDVDIAVVGALVNDDVEMED